MNIVEFLDEVGQTKLRFQFLHDCLKGMRVVGRGRDQHVEVRFGTTETQVADALGDPKRVGIIVWIDRADFDRAQQKVTS